MTESVFLQFRRHGMAFPCDDSAHAWCGELRRRGHDDAGAGANRKPERVRGFRASVSIFLSGRVRPAITWNRRWLRRSRCCPPIRGFPVVDIQAAGGLYNSITLQIFPEPMRRVIVRALTPLSVTNFCRQIAQEQHLDPQAAALADLTAQQRSVVAATDRMRNVSPRVLQCVVDGTTVTF